MSGLIHLTDDAGKTHAYINCRECGPSPVAEEMLQQQIDSPVLPNTIFRSIQVSTCMSASQATCGRLAKPTGSTARGIWHPHVSTKRTDAVVRVLKTRPKAIVFTPQETGVIQWQGLFPNLVIANRIDGFPR